MQHPLQSAWRVWLSEEFVLKIRPVSKEKLSAAALKSVHMHKAKIVMQVFSISLQNPWGEEKKKKRRVNVLGYGSFFLLRFLSFIEKNILLRL